MFMSLILYSVEEWERMSELQIEKRKIFLPIGLIVSVIVCAYACVCKENYMLYYNTI